MKGATRGETGPAGPLGRNASKVSGAPTDPPQRGLGREAQRVSDAGGRQPSGSGVSPGALDDGEPAAGPGHSCADHCPRPLSRAWRWDPDRDRWVKPGTVASHPGAGDIAEPPRSAPHRITSSRVDSAAASDTCHWCGRPMYGQAPNRRYCCKRCRQSAWRLRRRRATEAADRLPKRLCYADPPFPGKADYYRAEPTYAGEVDHVALVSSLQDYDGWALSTSPEALWSILPLCPPDVHVCPWVKPIGVPAKTYGMHTTWEPVIVKPARSLRPGFRDWLRAMPARGGGTLIGRKPLAFVAWLFDCLGAAPGIDSLDDLFPGTGIVGQCWEALASLHSSNDASAAQLALPGLSQASIRDEPSPLEYCDALSLATRCDGGQP